jgi:NAD(P)-dependent dehydrogenase (short-subunit alcohol dehydrogenase family)
MDVVKGSQYCAWEYTSLLGQCGMTASMSWKGNCYDNAPMESFWGVLKNEQTHHCRYATRQEAMADITEYIEIFYNRQKGVWRCMKYEIPLMLKQGKGAIVNNSSIAGICTEVGLSIYAASKHAVLGLTRAAALDYAHRKLRINAVCPEFVHTPMLEEPWQLNPQIMDLTVAMVPMKRFGKPEEVASAVLWMCSDEASFMTGKEMVIGGGQAIHA